MLAERAGSVDQSARPVLSLVPAPRKRLVAPPSTQGRKLGRQYEATRLVVDDFGDAVALEHRCSGCLRWQAVYVTGRCRDCRRFMDQLRRRRDPEGERERKRQARLGLLQRDPTLRERERARHAANLATRRERDPERELGLARGRQARYVQRVQGDPERRQERREVMRVDNVLRRMDEGRAVGNGHRRVNGTTPERTRKYVPSAPLALALASSGRRMKDVAADAGQSERLYLSWRTGERRRATWGAADAVLVALDRFWWEAFDPADSAPKRSLARPKRSARAAEVMPDIPPPRALAGSSEAFSGQRSRDVVAWIAAAEAAVALWEPDESAVPDETVAMAGAL